MLQTTNKVPRETEDPIQYLLDKGHNFVTLAHEWELRSTDTIYRLKRYEYIPPPKMASKMAASFGWTPGEVTDFWFEMKAKKGE